MLKVLHERRMALLVGLAAALLVAVLAGVQPMAAVLDGFEIRTLDMRMLLTPPPTLRGVITHVDIDDQSIDALGRWPWSRDRHAVAVEVLHDLGARRTVFDVEFYSGADRVLPEGDVKVAVGAVRGLGEQAAFDVRRSFGDLTSRATADLLNPRLDDDDRRDVVQGRIQETQDLVLDRIRRLPEDLAPRIQDLGSDLDRDFAEAVAGSGNVYLPYHMLKRDVPADLAAAAVPLLQNDLDLEPGELAAATGRPAGEFDLHLVKLQRLAIREVLRSGDSLPGPEEAAAVLSTGLPQDATLSVRAGGLIQEEWDRERREREVTRRFTLPVAGAGDPATTAALRAADGLMPPIASLLTGARACGLVSIEPDTLDGVLRRVPLLYREGDRLHLQLALRLGLELLGVEPEALRLEPGLRLGIPGATLADGSRRDLAVPMDAEGMAILRWAGGRGQDYTGQFEHVPFMALVELSEMRMRIRANTLGLLAEMRQAVTAAKPGDHLYAPWAREAPDLALPEAGPEDGTGSPEDGPGPGPEWEPDRILDLAEQLAQGGDRFVEGLRRTAAARGYPPERLAQVVDRPQAQLDDYRAGLRKARVELERLRQIDKSLRAKVDGRICIIGSTHTGSTDLKPTPVHPWTPGVMLHSNTINCLLNDCFVRKAPPWASAAAVAACGLVISLLSILGNPVVGGVSALAGVLVWFGLSTAALGRADLWLPVTGPSLGMVVAFGAVTAFRQLTEERQKREIRNAFSHYMTPAVVEDVIRNPDKLRLGGERRVVSVYFSDVAGFTSISEALAPEDLVHLLNDYLGQMTDIILESGGTLDKYIGDAVMAFWGAPLDMEDHARRACLAALDCQDRLAVLRQEFMDRGLPRIDARAGINSGAMIVGNMGSARRFNYTVMGDAVNLAARLEPANKTYGTSLMISEFTHALCAADVEVRELDLLRVKGKEKPVRVFELMARKGGLAPAMVEVLAAYERGLALYKDQQWDAAMDAFRAALAVKEDDGPAASYLERCKQYQASPPGTDWDGVYTMKTK